MEEELGEIGLSRCGKGVGVGRGVGGGEGGCGSGGAGRVRKGSGRRTGGTWGTTLLEII